MERREFIRNTGIVGASLAAGLAAPAVAQDVKELKMVTSWPKNFPGLGTAAQRFAKRIEQASGGRYKIRVFAGGELVHPLKCHDAVQEGTADLYHSAEYYYQGKVKGYAFFSAVPFGFCANEMNAWIQHGGGQALWDEMSADFGIKPLPGGNTGSQMGGWFAKPIQSLDDFKGLKMRIPGLGGDVLNAIGGTSVTLAGAEILPALQSGAIDAAEWVGPWNDLAFGFYKVVKNYQWPGFHEPGTMLSIGVSKKMWDAMGAADQALFTACAIAENSNSLAEYNANNTKALQVLIDKHGVQLVEFGDEVYRALWEATKDVVAQAGDADPISAKTYKSYQQFRKQALAWSRLSDQGYMNKRSMVLR